MEIGKCSWITTAWDTGDIAPVFRRVFTALKAVDYAELQITALGVYEAELNGKRVGDFVLAPGWTSYQHRLQVQTYDITRLIGEENELRVTVGRGWFRSPIPGWINSEDKERRLHQPCGLIARLFIRFSDGSESAVETDGDWQFSESPVRFSEIYDGERYDARIEPADWQPVSLLDWPKDILIPQEGEIIRETERIAAQHVFRTPRGETVVDFGQEITGYVEFTVDAKAGDEIQFIHGEVLDAEGNFYNANYRGAKAAAAYTCREGKQTWHPRLTFFGFRYIKLLAWPNDPRPEDFTAIAVHSDMKRTGELESGSAEMNRLFSNIVWGQRGNFLDVPTDCPQRDERLGWTGDAQVFIKAASYFFDVERFFRKWLHDMAADQYASGEIGQVIPDVMPRDGCSSAAWGDAAVICPWQVYQTYGNSAVLEEQFECMKGWTDYITASTAAKDLWTGHFHFGDWLSLDAPEGSRVGATRLDFIATAFYAYSVELVAKAGKLLGRDMAEYEALHDRITAAFQRAFPDYQTQTEHVLAVRFNLCPDRQKTAGALAEMVKADGKQLRTGFVGTPYLLHVLSDYGHADLAWDLLLRRSYPGWLYPVTKGATTVWEHWDGIKEDGSFWSESMNSFNHYAYGAVGDWVFEQAAGIRHDESHPGFAELIYAPHPDQRLGWLAASLQSRYGRIHAAWRYENGGVRYELETPVRAHIRLKNLDCWVEKGKYTFWE
ncbi:MAG: family 78 glycoside hydrolase catalytic domain [Clostridia bacterium]|nr:family 78 glycoside hydrolase catalytic domain [Clostridia bacterium]